MFAFSLEFSSLLPRHFLFGINTLSNKYRQKRGLLYRRKKLFRQKRLLRMTKLIFRASVFVCYRFFRAKKLKRVFLGKTRRYLEQRFSRQFRYGVRKKTLYTHKFKTPNITRFAYLRHLEINPVTMSLMLLPIPYTYFYSFLLDRTYLWKSLLVELNAAHRRHGS